MDQTVPLWRAITISPGVSGDWVWLSDKEIEFTPDPSFVENTTYTVSLSAQLKDLQAQGLIPYTFTFCRINRHSPTTIQKILKDCIQGIQERSLLTIIVDFFYFYPGS